MNVPAMGLGGHFAKCQTEARGVKLSLLGTLQLNKFFENFVLIFLSNARSLIADGDPDLVWMKVNLNLNRLFPAIFTGITD